MPEVSVTLVFLSIKAWFLYDLVFSLSWRSRLQIEGAGTDKRFAKSLCNISLKDLFTSSLAVMSSV